MGRLTGKCAVITGGASGIGEKACEVFAQEGAKVAVLDIDDRGQGVAGRICASGGQAIFLKIDATSEEQVAAAADDVRGAFGRVDVLYNNAGGSSLKDGPVTECPTEEFWLTIKRDLFTTWLCSRFVIPLIAKSGGGCVINTTSGIASRGGPGRSAYAAAKGAIISLTRSMAVDFAPQRIRVNAIQPGLVGTDRMLFYMEQSPSTRAYVESTTRLGIVEPIDIAHMAVYLASDESKVTTGQILAVDSGYLA